MPTHAAVASGEETVAAREGTVAARERTGEAVIRSLLLTDLVDSTKLVEKLGDARAYDVATRHDRIARDLLLRWDGLEIDKTDGFLLLFERPIDAVQYALAYHQALADLSVELGVQLRARAGIHLGEVFLRRNDPEDVARGAKPLEVEGLAKPTAARAMSLAAGKQTLLTQGAFDMARQAVSDDEASHQLRWLAHGPYLFKGVEEPVEIFEVGLEGHAPLAPPADTAKVRRAVAAGDELTLGWRPAPGLEIPRRSGWVLEKRLGEGGFGEVWQALQPLTAEQRVFKFCYDASQLRSLQREVTLFRLLRESLGHSEEIVRILDWSFDEAPYFIEEELVGGGDLLEWSAEHGGIAQVPVTTRLEIAAQIADALAAAHSVGVLHKDVKPSNVLVAADRIEVPRVKLADFGISEVLDEKALLARGITVMGMTEVASPDGSSSVTGSHLYMAPEVAEGRVASVEADIYSLGVLLYQAVVGDFRRALGTGWQRDIDDDLLAADIAAFVDRDPSRRPASARDVAERLRTLEERRRQLAAEEQAREQAEAARLALLRAHRRRKLLAITTAAAVLVLVVVSLLAIEATQARDIAKRRSDQAEKLIRFMVGDLRKKLEPVGRLEILDDVGAEAMEYFAAVAEDELSDDELLVRAAVLSQIGEVQLIKANADLPTALRAFEESLDLARNLLARDPDDADRRFGLGQSHFWVGYVYWQQGDLDQAMEQFRSYLALAEWLVARDPDNLDWQLELGYAHSNIGSILESRGQLEAALEQFRQTLRIKASLVESDPKNLPWQLELANQHNLVAGALRKLGDFQAALEHFRADHAIIRQLASVDASNNRWLDRLANSHNSLGSLKQALGDLAGAIAHHREDLRITRALADNDPTNGQLAAFAAVAATNLGFALMADDETEPAIDHLRTAQADLQRLVDKDPGKVRWQRHLARASFGLAAGLFRQRDRAPAEALLRQSISTLESLATEGNRESVGYLGRAALLLGTLLDETRRRPEAEALWSKSLQLLEPTAEGSQDFKLLDPLARLLYKLGQTERAEELTRSLLTRGYRDPEFLNFCRLSHIATAGP
ncbi:MAG: protein kinase [Acidobacteriota bacterium]